MRNKYGKVIWTFFSRNSGRQVNAAANDGKWHHICATWENTDGSWKLFKDGGDLAYGTGLEKGRLYSENILHLTKYLLPGISYMVYELLVTLNKTKL